MKEIRLVKPGQNGHITNEHGLPEKPPEGWAFLPAGDAAVTRKVTAQGPIWRVQVKKGRRMQSLGIWAPIPHIVSAKEAVESMRADPGYEKKKAQAAQYRAKKQEEYSASFEEEVARFLGFHPKHKHLESKLARLVTDHAIPVGSGTVARTQMIPVEERAEKAVIAWMRHKTTGYDDMKIARIKGERRAVRRQLAATSRRLLDRYRKGEAIPPDCPLRKALSSS
ncbi:MAG TPA: DUF2293 domain-containing protein [Cytophagales bacterium]|nr:DUF2293 domain-containing protein [Cytophagales bacterium]HAP58089.1 DUF2293 domain-containing protein [Cytophagales bacterium]